VNDRLVEAAQHLPAVGGFVEQQQLALKLGEHPHNAILAGHLEELD